jgi:hypothetical protein
LNPNEPQKQEGNSRQEDYRLRFIDYFQAPGARTLAVALGAVSALTVSLFTGWQLALLIGASVALLVSLIPPLILYLMDLPYQRIKKTILSPLLVDERVRFTVKGGKTLGGFFVLTEQSMIFLSLEDGDHRLELTRGDVKTVILQEDRYSIRIFLNDTQFIEVLSGVYMELYDVLLENHWNVAR